MFSGRGIQSTPVLSFRPYGCPPTIRWCKYRVVLVRITHRTLPRRFPLVQFVGLQLRTGQSLIVHRQRSVSKHRQSCLVEHDKQLFNIETNKNTDVQIFSHRRHQHIQTNSSVITRGSGSLVTFWWTATACKRSFSWFRCNHWHRNFWRPLFLFLIYLLLLFLFMCFYFGLSVVVFFVAKSQKFQNHLVFKTTYS